MCLNDSRGGMVVACLGCGANETLTGLSVSAAVDVMRGFGDRHERCPLPTSREAVVERVRREADARAR